MSGGRTPAHVGAIPLAGEVVPYTLYRVPRRKRLTILVNRAGELEVRGPRRTAVRRAESFLRENDQWVLERLRQARERMAARPGLEEGMALPFLDETLVLRLKGAHNGRVRRVGDELWLPLAEAGRERVATLLEGWYRKQARRCLTARLDHWCRIMGLTYARLAIRGQRTRWGSCSTRGNINLNWRLLFAPLPVVDYVVVHELCHLRHPDHSADFWALVSRYLPDHPLRRAGLRTIDPPW